MPPRRGKNKSSKKRPLDSGKSKTQPKERYIVVLFADIVGCSEISNHKKLSEYNDFISSFQNIFKKVCSYYQEQRYEEEQYPYFQVEARGDEGCLKVFWSRKSGDSLAKDVDTAVKIAFDIKRKWLFEKHNIKRILEDGLLPVDIGIGIHTGKVYVNKIKDKSGNMIYRPEGYAINLAKRVESASREGSFTHILLSESARGQLHNLKDELTYFFDEPFPINPKGISSGIKVFEVKHHFLSTNWYESPLEASVLYKDVNDEKVNILKDAYETNPTNLWLAEEFVYFCLINGNKKSNSEIEIKEIKDYDLALEVARRIANSELRDAGTLAIWGMIEGEKEEYEQECKRYDEASRLDPQNGNILWYLALSLSYSLNRQLLPEEEEPKDKKEIEDFYEVNAKLIGKVLATFEEASGLTPYNPWIVYDYACELSWWSQAEESLRKKAIEMLILAFQLNLDIKESAQREDYLKPIIDDPKIKKHLEGE